MPEYTEKEFDKLSNTKMMFGEHWRCKEERFIIIHGAINYDYTWSYWVGTNYTSVKKAELYLKRRNANYCIVWDLGMEQFAIITNI